MGGRHRAGGREGGEKEVKCGREGEIGRKMGGREKERR